MVWILSECTVSEGMPTYIWVASIRLTFRLLDMQGMALEYETFQRYSIFQTTCLVFAIISLCKNFFKLASEIFTDNWSPPFFLLWFLRSGWRKCFERIFLMLTWPHQRHCAWRNTQKSVLLSCRSQCVNYTLTDWISARSSLRYSNSIYMLGTHLETSPSQGLQNCNVSCGQIPLSVGVLNQGQ